MPIVQALISLFDRPRIALKTFVNPFRFMRTRWGYAGSIAARISHWLHQYLLSRAIVIDTVSREYAKWIKANYEVAPGTLHVIPNGANVDSFMNPDKDRRSRNDTARLVPRFLYAGKLGEHRGLDALVEAVALLDATERRFNIVVAGAGPLEAELRRSVAANGLSNTFTFTGWISYDDLPQLMWTCDWGIELAEVPISQHDPMLRGSYGQKPLQYLAAGLPVIAWDIDGAEFLRENSVGSLVGYRSIQHLSEVLTEAAELARQDGFPAVRARAEHFATVHRSQTAVAATRCRLYMESLGSR
jgi:glycosyltransferase involved in cell wall biosynthesis